MRLSRELKDRIKYFLYTLLGVVLICLLWNKTAYRDVETIRKQEVSYIKQINLEIINYDGYEGSMVHGGYCWYKAVDKNGYMYEFALGEWRGEIMLYNMKCLNAVSNN